MSQFPDHGINDPDIRRLLDAKTPNSNSEALLACTLALMTGHAQGCCDRHRKMMLKKIVANLSILADHPAASGAFRMTVASLQVIWARLLEQSSEPPGYASPARADAHRVLWHGPSETVQ